MAAMKVAFLAVLLVVAVQKIAVVVERDLDQQLQILVVEAMMTIDYHHCLNR